MEFTTRLGLHSKQPDSRGGSKAPATESRHGPDTRSGQGHDQEDSKTGRRRQSARLYTTFPAARLSRGFGAGLFSASLASY
ncbi:hypothetical protein DPMN_131327 [Dreissena polymorpha]|uniref:Uncharacterized protein n=1 Tax=Dreissena polymorpha TaxID=45954 RepID=A0A9D4H9C1_DREPO|nr:hypothetical protein DPMN_131327 [Dreissena polymorpha]